MSYQSKSVDSFNTRLRFYLFEKVLKHKSADFEPSLNEFLAFDLREKEDLIYKYTAKYYHLKREDQLEGINIDSIFKYLKEADELLKSQKERWRKQYYEVVYRGKFTENKYKELMNENECYYCHTPIEIIRKLISSGKIYKKNERGWNLEIDRKEPNQEYTNENCVAACYWCNNAKTDEFNAEEFKPIGKAIKAVFEKRLKEISEK